MGKLKNSNMKTIENMTVISGDDIRRQRETQEKEAVRLIAENGAEVGQCVGKDEKETEIWKGDLL